MTKRLNKRSFIIISLFIIAIGMMGFYIYRHFLFKADDLSSQVASANLITNNPSFDQGISQGWATSQSTIMSASTDHAPDRSIASLKVGSKHVVYSEPITVNQQDYFELSAYVKGAKGGEKVSFGWQELTADNQLVVPIESDSFNFFSVNTVSNQWSRYSAVVKIQHAQTAKIKVVFKNSTDGDVVNWDDFSLISFHAKDLGCQNTTTAKCIKFSDLKPSSDANLLTDNRGNIAVGAENISDKKIDGTDNYREVASKKFIEVKIPAANFNPDNSDLIVETRYKDNFNYSNYNSTSANYGAIISNLSPWFSSDGSYPTYGFASLGQYGNQAWQTDQTLFLNSKDSPKALKPVKGYYQFKIASPIIANQDPVFPIDFISVTKVSSAQSKAFIAYQKRTRAMKQAYLPDNNPVPAVNASGFTWFNSPSMELVLPYSKPSIQDSIKKTITAFSAMGETEPINFSIYTENNLNNLQFNLGTFSSNGNNIAPANLSVKKVFYEERQWIDSKKGNTYGLLPDRLEDYTSSNLAANTAQQFYLMATFPKDQAGGTYSGSIDIKVNGAKVDTIPVSIEVLPMTLNSSSHFNVVSRNPYSDPTALASKNKDLVLQNMVGHDMDTVMGTIGFKINNDGTPDISVFKTSFEKAYSTGANQKIAMYQGLSNAAHAIILNLQARTDLKFTTSVSLYDQLSDPLFINAMTELITELKQSVDTFNHVHNSSVVLALESTDEPGVEIDRRIYENSLDPIVHSLGLKTFTTYFPEADSSLKCDDSKLCGTYLNQTIPSLAPLIDYKIYHISDTGAKDSSGKIQGTDGFYTTYFSQLRNPVYDRFLSGLYADKLGAKIIYNWVYFDNGGGDPYNDFDISGNRSFPATAYDFVLAYPTWGGKINSSTSLEAIREGVKDSKYLATLQNLINKNPSDPVAQEAQKYLQDLLVKIKSDWTGDYVSQKNDYGFGSAIIKSLSTTGSANDTAVFDQIRKKMFGYIKTLSSKNVGSSSLAIQFSLQGRTNFMINGASIKVFKSGDNTETAQPIIYKTDLVSNAVGAINNIDVTGLSIGTSYDFYLYVNSYLAGKITNQSVSAFPITLTFSELKGGDIDGNGRINSIDYTLYQSNDPRADINNDGEINNSDFNIISANWSAN